MKIYLLLLLVLIQTLSGHNLKKVTLQLSWFDQFQFAGYYMAKEKGYYKELGLDVEIRPFQFGLNIPKMVSDAKIDFAVGRETLILEKAKNKNIVALYALFQASPLILMSTKKSGINEISDFKNKKIMTTIDDASEISLKSMMQSKKLDIKSLKFLSHTHNIMDLVNKKTDIISAYVSKSPYLLDNMGIEYNIYSPKDYGFDMYSDFLYTNNTLINKDIQTVQNFKEASLKGWKYAYKNIDEASGLILKKYNSQKLKLGELKYEAKELKKLSYYNTSELGKIDLNKLQRIHDLYNLMGLLPKQVNIDSFVYNKSNFYTRLTVDEKKFIKLHPIISVGEKESFKPIIFLNKLGLNDGIVDDYLDIISEKTGLHFISNSNTQNTLLTKLNSQEIKMLPFSPNLDATNLLFTIPYFNLHQTSFIIKNNDLKTIKKIGVLDYINDSKKNLYIKNAYPDVKISHFINIQKATEALIKNDIDLLYVAEEILLPYIKDNHIDNIQYAVSDIKKNTLPLSFTFKNNSIYLQSILNKAVSEITYKQHNTIRNKWIPVIIKNEFDWSMVWEIIAVLTIIIILILYRQISMNKLNIELQILNGKLKELSELDHLTKFYNRRYFENYVENIILKDPRDKSQTSLLLFDIDDFKKINDTYGHLVGDEVLRKLGKELKKFSRKSDIIARIGGEEFFILFQNTSLEGARIHSENIRKMIESLVIEDNENKIKFTVSMGLTDFHQDDTLDSVILRIDNCLYEAKKSGKNKLLVN